MTQDPELSVDERSTEVPPKFASSPAQWWAHVSGCASCKRFYREPDELDALVTDQGSTAAFEEDRDGQGAEHGS